MNLAAYLERIGYDGPLDPTLTTLTALHRAHLFTIPYENLNIHLGRRLTLDQAQIFAKIVGERRGGWCFEMNGLFAWVLRELGYDVRMLSSAVGRQSLDDKTDEDTHLILLVTLDQPYLVDVGFGNGIVEPLPLVPGEHTQGAMRYKLREEGGHWFYENTSNGGPGFDFNLEPHVFENFAHQCNRLQTSPDSGFVRTTVSFRFRPDGIVSLRGAVLTTSAEGAPTTRTIEDADDYAATLAEQFGLSLPEAPLLWNRVWANHQIWLKTGVTPLE